MPVSLLTLALLQGATPPPLTLGIYLQGTRIGVASYNTRPDKFSGKPARRTESRTRMKAGLIGSEVEIRIDGTVWVDMNGRPLRIRDTVVSAGRTNQVDAIFGAKTVRVEVVNGGAKTVKTLPYPNGPVVDDPLVLLTQGKDIGKTKSFYILDPLTASFVKNEIHELAPENGLRVVEIIDPRANTKLYLKSGNELVRVLAPMGLEMRPITRQEALTAPPKGKTPDLAEINRIKLVGQTVGDAGGSDLMVLDVTGPDLSKVAGPGQTVEGKVLTIAPARFGAGTIVDAAREKPEWVRPSLYVPSDDANMKGLAKKIVGGSTSVRSAAILIRDWVGAQMTPNAGIGVLRDAREVLRTKEGVCRDYAVLTATLLRAAGIPTRLVGGLVTAENALYYHAWCEVWDGDNWVGVDATRPRTPFSAGHIRLSSGTLEDAFTFPFWGSAKVEVREVRTPNLLRD